MMLMVMMMSMIRRRTAAQMKPNTNLEYECGFSTVAAIQSDMNVVSLATQPRFAQFCIILYNFACQKFFTFLFNSAYFCSPLSTVLHIFVKFCIIMFGRHKSACHTARSKQKIRFTYFAFLIICTYFLGQLKCIHNTGQHLQS